MNIKNDLRNLRLSREISINKMSEDLGISESRLEKIENGTLNPSTEEIKLISNYFNVSEGKLFFQKKSYKKLIITLSIITAFFLIISMSVIIPYHPRKVKSYIKVDFSELKEIVICEPYPGGKDKVLCSVDIKEDKEFVNSILNIKVVPSYYRTKKLKYWPDKEIIFYFSNNTYQVNCKFIEYDNKTEFIFENDCKIDDIIHEYLYSKQIIQY